MPSSKPVPIPFSQRLDDIRRGPLALVLWLGAALGSVALLTRQAQRVPILGLAQGLAAEVSSEVDGRLMEVLVQPFEDVAPGQPIARLDDAQVAARIETARAEMEVLQEQIEAERARLAREAALAVEGRDIDLRRILLDEEMPRLERLQEIVRVEEDLVERARIELQLERAEELVVEGLAPAADRDDLALQRDRLTARIDATRERIAALERTEEEAAARRARFESELVAAGAVEQDLAPLHAAVQAAHLRVEEIRVERRALTLSSPLAGRVRLLAGAGQALLAGEPVATVTGMHAESIVAYLPSGADVRSGARVLVVRRDARGLASEAIITRLGPAMEEMPIQLWDDPGRPVFGRPALLAGVSGMALTPGEVVIVRPLD